MITRTNLKKWVISLLLLSVWWGGTAFADWTEFFKLAASDGAAGDYFGYSVSITDKYAVVGAYSDDANGTDSGSAYVFKRILSNWVQQDKLTASDGAAGDDFGQSVSISGNNIIIGAPSDDDDGANSGSAYIFHYDGNDWIEQEKITASVGAAGDGFGSSVSISGNKIIVGTPSDDYWGTNSGSAYIFHFDGSNWIEKAKITPSAGAWNDQFGTSVSISGDFAVVGAPFNQENSINSGSAFIYNYDGSNWNQQAKLNASDAEFGDQFGQSVSISLNKVLIGATLDDYNGSDSGSAYIFERNGITWYEVAKLTASDNVSNNGFGWSVSISVDHALVSAFDDEFKGAAYLFYHDGMVWSEQAKLVASDPAFGDFFGQSVSTSHNFAIVGAHWDDDNGADSGSAYMYTGSWIQGRKWRDLDADGYLDENAVESERGLQDWTIYIDLNQNGQLDHNEPNDITDVNGTYALPVPTGTYIIAEQQKPCWEQTYPGGDETYNITVERWRVAEGLDFGNARSTEIHPSAWQQDEQDKLTPSDGDANDYFGRDTSISGDFAVTGAPFDDDNGTDSGSAYIFEPNDVHCTDWHQLVKLTALDGAAGDEFGKSVSINSNYAIVGAAQDDDNGNSSGSAYIFHYDGSDFTQQQKLIDPLGSAGDQFGFSVSISGDYAVVGAPYSDLKGKNSSGSAYIFKRSGTNWTRQATLSAVDGDIDDIFGTSVSISGDYAIVGSIFDDDNGSNSGSAYVFKRNGTNWNQQIKLTASDGIDNDFFGISVSISGDYAIVGASGNDDDGDSSGSAYVFKRYGRIWRQQNKLTASDGAAGDNFGRSVSISGGYAVVGAYGNDDNGNSSGSAYLFEYSGTTWTEQVRLLASDGDAGDEFGFSVSISGGYINVGAYRDDDNGIDSGSTYIFGKILCPWADLTHDCFIDFHDVAVLTDQWLQGIE